MEELGIGKNIRFWRKKKGITQSVIGKHIGVKREYVSRMETGKLKNPTIKTLIGIAEILQVSIADLVDQGHLSACENLSPAQLLTENNELRRRLESAQKQVKAVVF